MSGGPEMSPGAHRAYKVICRSINVVCSDRCLEMQMLAALVHDWPCMQRHSCPCNASHWPTTESNLTAKSIISRHTYADGTTLLTYAMVTRTKGLRSSAAANVWTLLEQSSELITSANPGRTHGLPSNDSRCVRV